MAAKLNHCSVTASAVSLSMILMAIKILNTWNFHSKLNPWVCLLPVTSQWVYDRQPMAGLLVKVHYPVASHGASGCQYCILIGGRSGPDDIECQSWAL